MHGSGLGTRLISDVTWLCIGQLANQIQGGIIKPGLWTVLDWTHQNRCMQSPRLWRALYSSALSLWFPRGQRSRAYLIGNNGHGWQRNSTSVHVASIRNSEYKSWMFRDDLRIYKDSASHLVEAYQDACDLWPLGNQRDDNSRQSCREPIITSLFEMF